jgi:uncharacterized paraquat-inducible protein A
VALADSGQIALEGIILASIIVPLLILAAVCWVFWRVKKRDEEAARRNG